MHVFSPGEQARWAQDQADVREQDDANTQRSMLVVDPDGDWLLREIRDLGNADGVAGIPRDRCFRFLGEDQEALMERLSAYESGTVIEMSAGGNIRRVKGHDYDTWIFRIDNGYSGRDGEYFDLAFRRMDSGDHLPCLLKHKPSRVHSR